MYTHIEGNIYSIFVPLPDNPLRNLNAYLIKDDKRSLLIDTGFRRDECREALLGGLAELGVSMDNTDICLTHLHSDHTGLAPEIAGPNSKIFMSREDSRRLREFQRSANTHRTEEYTLQGFSLDETAFLRDSPMRKYNSVQPMDNTYVGEGDVLEYGGPHPRPHLPLRPRRQGHVLGRPRPLRHHAEHHHLAGLFRPAGHLCAQPHGHQHL